jgi:hypothetical protein
MHASLKRLTAKLTSRMRNIGMFAAKYVIFAWMTKHQVPGRCHERMLRYYSHGSSLRTALQNNPYDPIGNVKRYTLYHAEAVAAAQQCDNAGSPERAAAVLQHVLKAKSSGTGECGLT